MTNSTMIAPGGFFFLEGDPLGVRVLEDQLAWHSDGPLPEWLDGVDPDFDLASSVDERMVAATLMLPSIPAPPPPTLVVPAPKIAPPPIKSGELKSTIQSTEYPSCEDSIAFENCDPVEENSSVRGRSGVHSAKAGPQTEIHEHHGSTMAPMAIRTNTESRRRVSVDELTEANHCFIAEAAGVLWAVPLEYISYVSRKSRARMTIDLRASDKPTLRDGVGIAVTLFSEVAIRFDRSLGPRVVRWTPLLSNSEAPRHAIAESVFSGVPLLLFDAQVAINSH